ncbi:hypothetical protein ACFX14_036156 [Malus domestica]
MVSLRPISRSSVYHQSTLSFRSSEESEVSNSLDEVDGVVDHGIISKFTCMTVIASESVLSVVDNLPKNAVKEP